MTALEAALEAERQARDAFAAFRAVHHDAENGLVRVYAGHVYAYVRDERSISLTLDIRCRLAEVGPKQWAVLLSITLPDGMRWWPSGAYWQKTALSWHFFSHPDHRLVWRVARWWDERAGQYRKTIEMAVKDDPLERVGYLSGFTC